MNKDNFCKYCKGECTNNLFTYKFRVELLPDVTKFISRFIIITTGDIVNLVIDTKNFQLGCTVELTTHQTITTVRDVLSCSSNLHVAVETLKELKDYTGIRIR